MKKNPQIFWSITLITVVAIIWVVFAFKKNDKSGNMSELLKNEDAKSQALPLGEGQLVTDSYFGDKQYKHTILGFGFSYPDEYTISSFGNFFDSVGETILLQKIDKAQGLQILITPFDEDLDLTIKRIKKDLPSLSVLEPREIQIGSDEKKVQMVVFESNNNLSTGKSYEGWFVYRKNLYQISSSVDSKELFDKITSSWKLEE
jgi:hypothetical protein